MSIKVIILGKSGSGKTTLADLFASVLDEHKIRGSLTDENRHRTLEEAANAIDAPCRHFAEKIKAIGHMETVHIVTLTAKDRIHSAPIIRRTSRRPKAR